MLPKPVTDNKQRIDGQILLMDGALAAADMRVQTVFAAYLVTLASGHVEIGLREILRDYGAKRSNPSISNFIGKTIDRENSLNCEKVRLILDRFDGSWHVALSGKIASEEAEAVNSLKTLRDLIAHGRPNGTGYLTVKNYYKSACRYIDKLAEAII